MKLFYPTALGIVLLLASPRATAAEPWDPISAYHERQIEGWRVLVHQKLDCEEQRRLCDDTMKLLGDHLYRISRVVPAAALAKLRQVPIWVELNHPRHSCMCYHQSPVWLREHEMNPEKSCRVPTHSQRTFSPSEPNRRPQALPFTLRSQLASVLRSCRLLPPPCSFAEKPAFLKCQSPPCSTAGGSRDGHCAESRPIPTWSVDRHRFSDRSNAGTSAAGAEALSPGHIHSTLSPAPTK